MNIWALSKDVYLKHILLVLVEQFGADSFTLSADWQDDVQAIGICKPDDSGVLAHVFTYGQTPGRFGVHLEFPRHPDDLYGAVATEKEDISLNDLVEILAVHLDLEFRSP